MIHLLIIFYLIDLAMTVHFLGVTRIDMSSLYVALDIHMLNGLPYLNGLFFSFIQYYTHRDYAHTFRSKKEVQHFLDTGEVKGKGLLQKVSISTFVNLFKSFVPSTISIS
jgi:hypothetical protein